MCEQVAEREQELVDLLCELVRHDTVTHAIGTPAREEWALQRFLGERLAAAIP